MSVPWTGLGANVLAAPANISVQVNVPGTLPGNLPAPPGGGGGAGAGSGGTPAAPYVATPSYSFVPPVTGAIVEVTLQIDQYAVIERNAFKATLQLNNNAGSSISDLQVTINPIDAFGNPALNLFDVLPPSLTGLNAVDGTGSIAKHNNQRQIRNTADFVASSPTPEKPLHLLNGLSRSPGNLEPQNVLRRRIESTTLSRAMSLSIALSPGGRLFVQPDDQAEPKAEPGNRGAPGRSVCGLHSARVGNAGLGLSA